MRGVGAFHCLLTRPPRRYSIAPIVSRVMRARALICLFRASTSAVESPCFKAFLFPLGAPPAAPCIRQTLDPPHRRSLALQPAPLRFGVASQRLVHIQEHGVDLRLFYAPLPPRLER